MTKITNSAFGTYTQSKAYVLRICAWRAGERVKDSRANSENWRRHFYYEQQKCCGFAAETGHYMQETIIFVLSAAHCQLFT